MVKKDAPGDGSLLVFQFLNWEVIPSLPSLLVSTDNAFL